MLAAEQIAGAQRRKLVDPLRGVVKPLFIHADPCFAATAEPGAAPSSTLYPVEQFHRSRVDRCGRRQYVTNSPERGMPMRAAVVIFPGSNRERDVGAALRRATGHEPLRVWHRDT